MKHTIFFIIVVGIILVIYAGTFVIKDQKQTQQVVFVPSVKGCAEKIQEQAIRGVGKEEPPQITLTENRGLRYYRAISHQCCKMAELSYEIENTNIKIYENWRGEGCRCICYSEISAEIKDLKPDTYNVQVIKKEAGAEDAQIISKIVTIS